ncbi:hyaluronidase PH-20-like [Kryptolebias marmoratus]|uniref:Hyaluronidase n=1 Tax=Kryptolebias marmoratus TaxID=37003 RepID=A0A3Q2ZYQ5_KRYMA|nr:hyaluronidase PH-20-like [Kryptolebias marmoratus]
MCSTYNSSSCNNLFTEELCRLPEESEDIVLMTKSKESHQKTVRTTRSCILKTEPVLKKMIKIKLTDVTHTLSAILGAVLALVYSINALPMTHPPMLPGHHFMFTWNAPTELCESRFGMPLDLSYFSFVSSTLKTATNQRISIFYTDRFGIFPYVDEDTGEMYDEGLPQSVDIKEHHELAEDDIVFYIPIDQPGLAVLDFEEWRPQWDRNWGSKDIYREISIDTVKKKNPCLSEDKAEGRAKFLFERAAKKYFIQSIRIGKKLRPNRLWGYYLYPDCYNYNYNQDMVGFTGECPPIEKTRNDDLLWLWKESTALFPSIYLELVLKDSEQARLFVRHRILEAMRVSTLPNSSYSIPIYAYIRPVYKDSVDDYMSEFDLVNTIGEAAALGAAGIVSWGDMNVTDTEDSCFDSRRHLEKVMNPYILNVSTATRLCSEALCQGQGRCVRKNWNDNVYLHLDPRRYQIQRRFHGSPWTVSGGLSQDDIKGFNNSFDCMCYTKAPCRSVLTINVLSNPIVTQRNKSVYIMCSPLFMFVLICVRYVVM